MTLDQLKGFIAEQQFDTIYKELDENPNVLDEQDNAGVSGYMLINYTMQPYLIDKANNLKYRYNFYEAIIAGKLEVVKKYLSEEGGLAKSFSPDGFSAVSLAAYFNKEDIVHILIDHDADPNVAARNPSKVNALHAAVAQQNLNLCRFLIEKGADVNKRQTNDVTPLLSATHRGNLALVNLLVENDADINAQMNDGTDAITMAMKEGHEDVAAFLKSRRKSQ